ncbi:MAG: iron ABC transporter substrate-binding protein [Burkholderiales bacterium]
MHAISARFLVLFLALVFGSAHAGDVRRIADASGREIALPAEIKRVYAAGPPASVFVFAIAPEKLIGWTRAMRPDEAAFLPPQYANLPELGRLTGRGNTANVEVVLAAKPDLIVDAGSTAPSFVSLAQRVETQTGIPYLLFDGRFSETARTFRLLGAALNEAARGEMLAAYVENTLSVIREKIARAPAGKKPRVYYARGANGLTTALQGSINVEALELLAAVNVAGKSEVSGGLTPVSFEQVLAWNPDVIVTTDEVFYYHTARQDARWANLPAVKARRIYLSPRLPFGWFDFPPGPNRLIGVLWFAHILYPDLFRDSLPAAVKKFYTLFYHREPADAEVDALLNPKDAP